MSTLSLRKIKHDSSAVDNITLDSNGNLTLAGTIAQSKAMTTQYDGIGVRMGSSTANTNRGSTFLQHTYVDAGGNQGNYVYNHSLRQNDGTYIANVYTADYSAGVHSWYHPNGGLSGNPVMQIDASGRVTMPYQPNFQSYLGTNWTFSSGSVVPFNTTNWNIGSHYNTSSYRFTAPVAGTYAFYTHTYTSVSSGTFRAAHFQFRVNGSARIDATNGGFSPDGGYSYHPAMNNFVTIRLSINDYVDFYLSGGDYGSGTIFSAGSTLCVFGGHLIA
jgi:C1q domain